MKPDKVFWFALIADFLIYAFLLYCWLRAKFV